MTAVLSSLLSVWEFWKLHPGIVLVLAGVAGEGTEVIIKLRWKTLSEKCERRLKGVEFVSWVVVVIGLAMEISDAAKSDNEVIALNQKIEQINPLNEPIRSVRAVVYLLVRGDFSSDPIFFPNQMFFKGGANIPIQGDLRTANARFVIRGVGGAWLVLDCEKLESDLASSFKPGEPPQTNSPNARRFNMVFNWPGPRTASMETTPDFQRFWIDRKNISTSDLDKADVSASAMFFGFFKGMEVINGSCDVTINGNVPRKFSNPKIVNDCSVDFSTMEKSDP